MTVKIVTDNQARSKIVKVRFLIKLCILSIKKLMKIDNCLLIDYKDWHKKYRISKIQRIDIKNISIKQLNKTLN